MALQERLVELRYPIAFIAASAVAVLSLHSLGPSFASIVNFFWPLLLSTGCFLATIVVLLRISPPPSDVSGDRTGEELMHYVTARPEEESAAAEHEW